MPKPYYCSQNNNYFNSFTRNHFKTFEEPQNYKSDSISAFLPNQTDGLEKLDGGVKNYDSNFTRNRDENWSLVELLSRTGSATSTSRVLESWDSCNRTNKIERSCVFKDDKYQKFLNEEKEGMGRIDSTLNFLTKRDLKVVYSKRYSESESIPCYNDSMRDSCLSSSSSISWAEDALETGESEHLARAWNDIEAVCAGDPKPPEMTQKIYDECLLWRRAFPEECDNPLHRFKSMEEFQLSADEDKTFVLDQDENSTPTPTNDTSFHQTFLQISSNFNEDEKKNDNDESFKENDRADIVEIMETSKALVSDADDTKLSGGRIRNTYKKEKNNLTLLERRVTSINLPLKIERERELDKRNTKDKPFLTWLFN